MSTSKIDGTTQIRDGTIPFSAQASPPYTSVSGTTELTSTHFWVKVTAACTINLPTAVGITGREYIITATADNVVVDPYLSETINGNTTMTLMSGNTMEIRSDGTNWRIT